MEIRNWDGRVLKGKRLRRIFRAEDPGSTRERRSRKVAPLIVASRPDGADGRDQHKPTAQPELVRLAAVRGIEHNSQSPV